ncbi:PP2C family protein-serine/threonine phosphatase [Kitasatospora phosalacinea]|uniref:PP2C family protein-serine/threonine phosphatase n=1 Tax=Kitasatospora phosalacinea TaxID=2065 RepID=UPI000524EDA7|nr:SpoIIE family protein phosphatase [Kitasatospora phosalacinea]
MPTVIGLDPGQSLVLYTDGITEARNSDGEQFGEDRLLHALTPSPGNAPTALEAITKAVRAFTGDSGTDDDQAVLVLTATAPADDRR